MMYVSLLLRLVHSHLTTLCFRARHISLSMKVTFDTPISHSTPRLIMRWSSPSGYLLGSPGLDMDRVSQPVTRYASLPLLL